MIFEEHHFEYGDFISREYGLIFAHADTSSFLSITGELKPLYIFNKKNKRRYAVGDDYAESALSFDIDIITDDFRALTKEDRRAVEKKLFNAPTYKRLYVDLADDCTGETYEFVNGEMKRVYLNCRLMNPVKIEDGAGRVVGFTCTVECDSWMLYMDEVEMTFQIGSSSKTINVPVDTDTNDYTYPVVTIKMGEIPESATGDDFYVTLTNTSDNSTRLTQFVVTQSNDTITVNSETNYISGNYYGVFSRRHFPRLVDGDNFIEVSGFVDSVTFTWSNRRLL